MQPTDHSQALTLNSHLRDLGPKSNNQPSRSFLEKVAVIILSLTVLQTRRKLKMTNKNVLEATK
jgi:hypothetical protein